jgi:hypothetical protein
MARPARTVAIAIALNDASFQGLTLYTYDYLYIFLICKEKKIKMMPTRLLGLPWSLVKMK